MNAFIIGSIAQAEEIGNVGKEYLDAGFDIQYVQEQEGYLLDLIMKTFDTIRTWADIVVVVPKKSLVESPVLSIGDGTRFEIAYAKSLNKPVVIHMGQTQEVCMNESV